MKLSFPVLPGLLCALLAIAPSGSAAELNRETVEDFERYVREAEAGMDKTVRNGAFLWAAGRQDRLKQVIAGKVVIDPVIGKGEAKVRDGLIHDWIGTVFITGATAGGVVALVQNYNNHKLIYKPEVMDSKLVSRDGNDFKVFLRLLKKKVLTVVLDTDHDVRYAEVNPKRWHSRSHTTRIAEVRNFGKADQRELPPGEGHGFLWRLYSYWRFEERDGGTFVECRAISLTREVPAGLGWLITPIIRTLPRESLERTLRGTREAYVRK